MTRKRSTRRPDDCPCGSSAAFQKCCGPRLNGSERAPTAEALMRSRYTAYVTGQQDYLIRSWHPDTRPADLTLAPTQQWLGLKILATEAGGPEDEVGTVEFVARFKIAGRGHRLHEISRFLRTADGWLYLDGIRGASDSSHDT